MSTLFPAEPVVGYARVAVERGIDRHPDGLTYGVPAALADLAAGERVIVPLGRNDQPTPGYVIERVETIDFDPERVKPVAQRDRVAVTLPAELLALARWMSGYYCAPIGMTLATMLPAAVKKNVGVKQKTMIDLGRPLAADEKISAKQRAVIDLLAEKPEAERPVEIRVLADLAGLKTTGPIKRLLERGHLEQSRRTLIEAAWSKHASDATAPAALTPAQTGIVEAIGGVLDAGFSTHLIYGVTGSGKTEVYIRLIEKVIAAGKTALLLVPEISLTPQTGGRLIGRFPNRRVVVLHSGLTAAQRHHQWAAAADGAAHIVMGARSAIFAPVPDGKLGLVIVDEEHEGSYKQDQVPRYHGRDVAIRRGQLAGVPVVLGSATPSLESWHNAATRRDFRLHRLPERAPGLALPRVTVVDFAEQRKHRKDRRVHLIGPVMEHAIGRTLEGGGQVLILLNRRGYASYITCPDAACGWVMNCEDCDVTVVYHRAAQLPTGGYVQCHHCGREQKLPATCPDCGRKVNTFGYGTQRVEEELARKFPGLELGRNMLRLDSDTMRSAANYYDALERFGAGEVRLMLGTQMIAKGLDYPMVRLVGVINADTAINLPDFRASERTFQLVSQVAGRSGRGEAAGMVVVQTFHPEAPAIRLAAEHDYEAFAAIELEERRRCGLPPYTRMARVIVRDEDHVKAIAGAERLAEGLRRLAGPDVRLRGPAPCPIARIAARHRQHVELLAPTAAALQTLLAAARREGLIHAGMEMAVDVDPVALL
jgi:primosomal protein N' (replication factor Y)